MSKLPWITTLLLPALALPIASCATMPNDTMTEAAAEASEPMSDGEILHVVHTLNTGEIEQARLALQRANSAEVRQTAELIVRDHRDSNARIEATARSLGVDLEPTPLSQGLQSQSRAIVQELSGLSGPRFDCTYLQKQVELHSIALETVQEDLLPNARQPQVRDLLVAASPKLDHHREQAQQAPDGQDICTDAQLAAAADAD